MMWLTTAAMLPAVAVAAYLYGGGVVLRVLLAVAAAAVTERGCQWLIKNQSSVGDGSAVLTGVIIGLSVPPLAPWYVPVFASLTGIALAKHCYGGLGNNPFNPAMAGYALAYLSFPADFSGWIGGGSFDAAWETLFTDAISAPTPLAAARLEATPPVTPSLFLSLASVIGGGWLLWRRIADWRLTLAFLGGGWLTNLAAGGDWQILLHGGFLFAAFFVITDPVTAATTPLGRCLYGAVVGALAVWLRHHGAHTDGIAFAILIGNILAPLCDDVAERWQR